jgi:hypothetical protein
MMSQARTLRVAWWAGIAVTGLIFAHGVGNLLGGGSFDSDPDRVVYGLVQVIAGLLIAAGLRFSARARRRGAGMVAAGVIAISILMPWFIIFTIPVGLGLIALAYSRDSVAV